MEKINMSDTTYLIDFPTADDLEVIDEQEVLTRFQNGDKEAFNTLMLKYQKRISNLVYKHIHDAETTKDLCQEVFLKAFKALPNFKRESAFYSWLYRIAVNCCIDFLRQQKRHKTVAFEELTPDYEDGLPIADTQPSPSKLAANKELGQIICKAIEQLPPKQQRVFRLRYGGEMQIKEIASLLDRSEGTVKTHLHHAHRRLRILLRPYLENQPLEWYNET